MSRASKVEFPRKTGEEVRLLFTPRPDLAGLVATSDLKRFLAAVPVEGGAPASILVTLDWQAALRR